MLPPSHARSCFADCHPETCCVATVPLMCRYKRAQIVEYYSLQVWYCPVNCHVYCHMFCCVHCHVFCYVYHRAMYCCSYEAAVEIVTAGGHGHHCVPPSQVTRNSNRVWQPACPPQGMCDSHVMSHIHAYATPPIHVIPVIPSVHVISHLSSMSCHTPTGEAPACVLPLQPHLLGPSMDALTPP
jgi:hypothetical protein